MTRHLLISGLLTLTALTSVGWAQDTGQKFELHGFGGWAYGATDDNQYALGTEVGNYENAQFSLHVVAFPMEDLTIVAQVQFDNGNDDVDLDYAFAEWFISDGLKLRFGRVKHPFGIYGEIFDVGTLRPFQYLPQGIYGGQAITAEAYNGVGLTGIRRLGDRWNLQYDLYAGQITGTVELPPGLAPPGSGLTGLTNLPYTFDDVLGTRLNLLTPIEGLTIGLSAYYSSEAEVELVSLGGFTVDSLGQEVIGGHLEYVGAKTWLRTEVVRTETADTIEQTGSYAELAYKLTPEWQVAARYEDWEGGLPGLDSLLPFPWISQFANHQEIALGVNYWVNSSLVLRLSGHWVEGNRFAFPSDLATVGAIFTGQAGLDDSTVMYVFGAQFSF